MAKEFVKLASVSELPDNSVRVFEANGQRIALCHVDNEFYAVADLCTHDGGPLGDGELTDHEIECPRHGARFDIKTGKVLCFPAVVPIATYPVEIRGTDVYVGV